MELFRAAKREWQLSPYPNIYYSKFFAEQTNRPNGNGMLVRAAKDAVIPYICYHGKRQLFVLSGRIQVNDDILGRGDFIILNEKYPHSIKASEDSMYLTFFEGETVEIGVEKDHVTHHNLFDECRQVDPGW